jgi:hypothetical protein
MEKKKEDKSVTEKTLILSGALELKKKGVHSTASALHSHPPSQIAID